jgi:hypothetical protein
MLNKKQAINECHLDEIFPRGLNHCVLVIKDEHGRILATFEANVFFKKNICLETGLKTR